jgi:hypothetical protein
LGKSAGALTDFTVTLWFKAESLNTVAATLIGKTGDAPDNVGWQVQLRRLKGQTNAGGTDTAGGIWLRLGNSSQKVVNVRYDQPAFTVGKWHHLACTFRGDTGTAEIFVDGKQLTRQTGIAISPKDTVSELRISSETAGFKGWVDELQIWDAPLTGSQIKEIVNQEGG